MNDFENGCCDVCWWSAIFCCVCVYESNEIWFSSFVKNSWNVFGSWSGVVFFSLVNVNEIEICLWNVIEICFNNVVGVVVVVKL